MGTCWEKGGYKTFPSGRGWLWVEKLLDKINNGWYTVLLHRYVFHIIFLKYLPSVLFEIPTIFEISALLSFFNLSVFKIPALFKKLEYKPYYVLYPDTVYFTLTRCTLPRHGVLYPGTVYFTPTRCTLPRCGLQHNVTI